MKNPRITKNPFMSLWLSGANKLMGGARWQATVAVQRAANKLAAAATDAALDQVTDFWVHALSQAPPEPPAPAPTTAKSKRRKARSSRIGPLRFNPFTKATR